MTHRNKQELHGTGIEVNFTRKHWLRLWLFRVWMQTLNVKFSVFFEYHLFIQSFSRNCTSSNYYVMNTFHKKGGRHKSIGRRMASVGQHDVIFFSWNILLILNSFNVNDLILHILEELKFRRRIITTGCRVNLDSSAIRSPCYLGCRINQ